VIWKDSDKFIVKKSLKRQKVEDPPSTSKESTNSKKPTTEE